MPIDPSKALGADVGGGEYSWTRDDVILYHLGLNAGVNATDPQELEYTYEKNLKVLPSFAVIPAFGSMGGIGNLPGLEFNLAQLLRGRERFDEARRISAAIVNASLKLRFCPPRM